MTTAPSRRDRGDSNYGRAMWPDTVRNVEDSIFGTDDQRGTVTVQVVDELPVMLDCGRCIVKMPTAAVRSGSLDSRCRKHEGGR